MAADPLGGGSITCAVSGDVLYLDVDDDQLAVSADPSYVCVNLDKTGYVQGATPEERFSRRT